MLTMLPLPETKESTVVVIPADPSLVQARADRAYRQLRVAAYARVSTKEEEQQSSYQAQKQYYTDKINANPQWTLQGIYADEGITGTSTKKRADFNRMIKACKQGKIDIILTKSISRFARNTVDALQYCRALRAQNIAVIFEKEAINTLEMSDEIILTVLSMIAQSESESQSRNVAMGIRMGYKAGKVPFRKYLLGYRKGDNGEFVVVPEQAEIVKEIFRRYLKGSSLQDISSYMEERRVMSPKGSCKWSTSTILSMLQNEKYAGDALLQKTFVQDCLSKKVIRNNGVLPMYLIQNHHEAIIDRITFNRVQEEIARRKGKRKVSDKAITEQSKYSSRFALTELLVCGECGTPYRRVTWSRNGKKKIVWRCISRLDHGTRYCHHSPTIEESLLHGAIVQTINDHMMEITKLIPLAKRHLEAAIQDDEAAEKFRLQNKINELKELRRQIVGQCRTEDAFDRYESQFQQIAEEMKELSDLLATEEQKCQTSESVNQQLDEIMELTENGEFRMTEYDDRYVRMMVECVRVNDKDSITVIFKGGVEVEAMLWNDMV